MAFSTTGGLCYITALTTLQRVEIQFVPPQITTTRAATHGELVVVGRSNPLYHWASGTKTLSLELDFYADTENREDVQEKCRWLEALAIGDGFDGGQERVRITFGRLFKQNEIWIVKSVNVRYELFDMANGMLPRQAYVTIEFALDPDTNQKQIDVKWS